MKKSALTCAVLGAALVIPSFVHAQPGTKKPNEQQAQKQNPQSTQQAGRDPIDIRLRDLGALRGGYSAERLLDTTARGEDGKKLGEVEPDRQLAQHPSSDRQPLREVRATNLVDAGVRNTQDMALGEIEDLIVDMTTGEVRYAVLEFDPGILSDEKLWGVPTSELRMSHDGNTVLYDLDRERLERATLDRSSFDDGMVFDGKRVMNNLDTAYGLYQPSSGEHAHRASDLIGENVVSRAGDGIGEIEDLVIDMNHQRVHYAVLEFDPGIASPEQNFAVPLHALDQNLDGSALVLDVDDATLKAMKSFTDDRWAHLDDRAWVADIDRYFVAVFPQAASADGARKAAGSTP